MQLRNLAVLVTSLCNLTRISFASPTYNAASSPTTPEHHENDITSLTNTDIHLPKREAWIANVGNGWAAYHETWETFIPAQAAASVLTTFYSSIVDKVLGSSTGLGEPGLFQAFELDNIRLEFSSDARKIPWDFIAAFAARMAARTQRGFTGQYNTVYVHMATDHAIRISLMVLRDAAGG